MPTRDKCDMMLFFCHLPFVNHVKYR